MDILSFNNETFDSFLFEANKIHKQHIALALQNYDKEIYSKIDHKRFKLIRIDERTILTSYGIITFKRKYYYDNFTNQYCYLLDNILKLPKSKRMSNELILKILDLSSKMTYKEVGESLSNEFTLSKYTIWKTIKDVLLETYFDIDINRNGNKIHVQIDEKYIGMINSNNKKRYYTLTIFAGKSVIGNKTRLLNKTVISSSNLPDLKKRLNDMLINRYKVQLDEEIYVSGDFAAYIRGFIDSIYCCKSKYVPDKFHVYKTIRDVAPDLYVDNLSLNDDSFLKALIDRLKNNEDVNANKLKNIIKNNPKIFSPYLDKEYLGCSQEGQNSHIYAPRFGKYANRFSPSTIEKLSLIREADAMKAKVILVHKKRNIPDEIPLDIPEIIIEDPVKYALDLSWMKNDTYKMFNRIKYGGYNEDN